MIIGELEDPNVWTDRDGNNRASLEVTAQRIQFMGSRGGDSSGGYGDEEHAGPGAGSSSSGGGAPAMQDEDIPF